MSYHIYNARGIVLREKPLREADLSLKILTRELGLINAIAIGVRKGNSRRRPPLTELSLSKVSLVRGKKDWRVTSASLETNLYQELKKDKKNLLSITRALNLIEKLVQGEEKHPELFDTVEDFINFLLTQSASDLNNIFESVLVIRILSKLGYINEKEFNKAVFEDKPTVSFFESIKDQNKNLIQSINKGIRESGLVK